MMKNFFFEVVQRKPRIRKKIPYVVGKVKINDFEEEFEMSLSWWSIKDYEQQWKDGFEHLKKRGKACFITTIYDQKKTRFLEWWVAFKIGNKIHIRNNIYFREGYDEVIGENIVTAENCYDFVHYQPRFVWPDGRIESEWTVDIEE
jgi:hypothetical protein